MKQKFTTVLLGACMAVLSCVESNAQITKLADYQNYNSAAIGTFHGVNFREGGFSSLFPIPNTNGKEFWTISDRGVNVDDANANGGAANGPCAPTYDKMYAFPNYAPKIHRIRVNGDSVQILQTIAMKRPNGSTATGIINPTGLGSTAAEVASTDVVTDCADFMTKTAPKDTWGIDSEGLVVDKDGYFWICEEGGPTIWKLNQNGVVVKRYTPYGNLTGPLAPEAQDIAIDTVFKYRKNNRGFEGIAITPNGKIYTIIQSPILYPTKAIGEASRVHRILEIDPATNQTRMFIYLNDGAVGSVGTKDWKVGELVAINNNEFLVLEAAAKSSTDIKQIYKINISNATAVTSASGIYTGGATIEALATATVNNLAANNIVPVTKTLVMDLMINNRWPSVLDKTEGLAIINDSTIAIANDNDYGQTCPLADGIPVATNVLSHVITYRLQGADKLTNYTAPVLNKEIGLTGPSTSQTPYLNGTKPGVKFSSILSAGDVVSGYKMCGTPDGLGAFDNGDGTFTVLMNHEFQDNAGVVRAHGSKGSFVSKWVINKSDLKVISGSDLIQNVKIWDTTAKAYVMYNAANPSTKAAFGRFCSADLPAVSAYYNAETGLGTQSRIFMNGEETGDAGRGLAHIVTGPEAGTTYELPYLGNLSWENAVANPGSGDKTIVVGTDDSTPGQVYIYVGTKTNSGNEIEKAGLSGGKLYGVTVTGMLAETDPIASLPAANTAFTLTDLGAIRDSVKINYLSNALGITTFLRPEDGAWDPTHPNDFYFNTTNGIAANSRIWKLHFNDLAHPEQGGTITAVLDGSEGQKMLDNMTIDNSGHILLVEDVGNNVHIGKIWQYSIANDQLVKIAAHDSTRFLAGGTNYLTQDEEASGILDVQQILGPGMFLVDVQAHYAITGELVEGGQLLTFYNPDTYSSNPEINIQGNSTDIVKGSTTASAGNNTDFGSVNIVTPATKVYTIHNAGPGALTLTGITITGTNASEFTLVNAPSFPLTIAAGSSQDITVRFTPTTTGVRAAKMKVVSNDIDEAAYDFALQGQGTTATAVESPLAGASSLKIYPNPAGDMTNITMTLDKDERITVTVYDAQGKEVIAPVEKNVMAGEFQYTLTTAQLKNGIYYVQVSSSTGKTKIKTVVAH